jgi:Tfp pilus assembly protein FimT
MEVLIVVTLIGILTGVSAPYVIKDSPKAQAAKSAETLAQTMRLARFRAIAMNRQVYVQFKPNGTANFYTAYVNLGAPGSVPTGTSAETAATRIEFSDMVSNLRGNKLPSGVVFGTGSASSSPYGASVSGAIGLQANPIVFDSRGTVQWPANATSSTGTIYVQYSSDPGSVRAVTLTRAGMIKVWQLKGGTWQ